MVDTPLHPADARTYADALTVWAGPHAGELAERRRTSFEARGDTDMAAFWAAVADLIWSHEDLAA